MKRASVAASKVDAPAAVTSTTTDLPAARTRSPSANGSFSDGTAFSNANHAAEYGCTRTVQADDISSRNSRESVHTPCCSSKRRLSAMRDVLALSDSLLEFASEELRDDAVASESSVATLRTSRCAAADLACSNACARGGVASAARTVTGAGGAATAELAPLLPAALLPAARPLNCGLMTEFATRPGSCTMYEVSSVGMPYCSPSERNSSSSSDEDPSRRRSALNHPMRCAAHKRGTNALALLRSGNAAAVLHSTPSGCSLSRHAYPPRTIPFIPRQHDEFLPSVQVGGR